MGEVATLRAGAGVQAIVPQSFEDAWRVATALAKSGMTPKGMEEPEKVLVVIMAGAELGMAPFQALQSFAMINGRPALWGDGMMAVARRFGVKVEETISGEGDDAVAQCQVTRPDTDEQVTRRFSVADAKSAGLWKKAGPWTQYPKRMLQMRARAWALRDGCADMLRGMKMAEEAQDYTVEVIDAPSPEAQSDAQELGDNNGFIHGEAAKLVVDHYTKLFEAAADVAEIEKRWASFLRKYWVGTRRCISHNTRDGIEIIYENNKFRLEDGDAALTKLLAAIQGASDLHELEAWRADAITEMRWGKLCDDQSAKAQAAYESAQENFAAAEHEALRKQRQKDGDVS